VGIFCVVPLLFAQNLSFRPTDNIHPSATEINCQSGLECLVLPRIRKGPALPPPGPEKPQAPECKRFFRHLAVPASFLQPVSAPAAPSYPPSRGSAQMRRRIAPNTRRVTSGALPPTAASNSAPCFTSRPPVYTNRCCRLGRAGCRLLMPLDQTATLKSGLKSSSPDTGFGSSMGTSGISGVAVQRVGR